MLHNSRKHLKSDSFLYQLLLMFIYVNAESDFWCPCFGSLWIFLCNLSGWGHQHKYSSPKSSAQCPQNCSLITVTLSSFHTTITHIRTSYCPPSNFNFFLFLIKLQLELLLILRTNNPESLLLCPSLVDYTSIISQVSVVYR